MLIVIAATAAVAIFILQPQLLEKENILIDAAGPLVEKIIDIDKEPEPTLFPYSSFDTSLIPTLEGEASSSKKIIADLNVMKIYLYTGETLEKEIDIKSRGRSTTFWETPPGAYKIESKEENHFSSIGHVWMPYSMQFFGNYFIHGWPYYEDGTPVGEGYSGGCIRLTTEDAKVVYEFANKKTPLYVFGVQQTATSEIVPVEYAESRTPTITATSFNVVDLDSGKIISNKNENELIAIGQLTHFMTAVISLELLNQYSIVTISNIDATSTLTAGTGIEALNLLYPLIFSHDIRAADTIVHRTAPSWFVKNMNMKAKAIGLENTTFNDALGIEKNTSTPKDLVMFMNYLYKHKSYLTTLSTASQRETEYGTWTNENPLVGKEYFKGGLVSKNDDATESTMLILKKSGKTYAVVLINSKDIQQDLQEILVTLQ